MRYKWSFIEDPATYNFNTDKLNPHLAKFLSSLGLENQEDVDFYLNPTSPKNHFSDFYKIEDAVNRIGKAIDQKERIVIHGDFDVDGISSTSILWDFLYRKLGANVLPLIPNRFTEGYGLSENSISRMREMGANLIITVDCGIKNIDLIKQNPDIDFIITDHHSYPVDEKGIKIDIKADNLAGIVHPRHPKSKVKFDEISGAAVTWQLIQALADEFKPDFDADIYLPLVAMATVTDVMPLKNENRYIVKNGLDRINKSIPLALKSLLEVASKSDSEIDAYHFGYVFGPRINAAGRVDDGIVGVRLLSTEDEDQSRKYAQVLDNLNLQRQELTQKLLKDAENQIDQSNLDKLIFIQGEDWPEGIIGLVAGKLCEKYNRPVIVATKSLKDGKIKGSARSIKEFNVIDALRQFSDLLVKFGGHVQAAGFSTTDDKVNELKSSLIELANNELDDESLIPRLKIISKLSEEDCTIDLVNEFDVLKPFGFGNPNPKFALEDFEIIKIKNIGKEKTHLKLTIQKNDVELECIGFSLAEDFMHLLPGDIISLVGKPKINEWNGNKNFQFEIIDIKKKTDE